MIGNDWSRQTLGETGKTRKEDRRLVVAEGKNLAILERQDDDDDDDDEEKAGTLAP